MADNWAVKMTADISDFDSKMDKVASAVNSVQNKITQLSTNISQSVSTNINTVSSSTSNFSKNFSSNVTNITNNTNALGSAFSKLGGIIAGVVSVGAMIKFGSDCISLASDLAEVQNVVDVAFPTMSEQVDEFSKTAMESFGLSEKAAKQYMGTLGSMIKSMGFSESSAEAMSEKLTGLAGDMASFYNIDTDTAFAKLRSGLSGETEPLKQLGINLSQANLESYALAQGIEKSYSSMSEAEKVMLRYQYILSATSDAQGDFARTSDSWANQVRILSNNFDKLKISIGQGLMEALTPVLQVINLMLEKLTKLGDKFSNLVSKAMGKDTTSETQSENKSNEQNTVQNDMSIDDADSTVANAVADTSEAKSDKAVKKAQEVAKSIKAAQSLVTKFDELNKESDNTTDVEYEDSISDTSDSASKLASTDLSDLVEDLSDVTYEADDANDSVSELPDWLQNIKDRANELLDGIKLRFGNLKDLFVDVKDNLVSIFTNSDVVTSVQNFITTVKDDFVRLFNAGVSIGTTLATNLVGGFNKYLSQNKERIQKHLVTMFDIASSISEQVTLWVESIADIFSVFANEDGQQITADIIGIFSDAYIGITELCGKIAEDVVQFITQPIIDNTDKIKENLASTLAVLEPVTAGIKEMVDTVVDGYNDVYDNHIRPLIDDIQQGISDIVGKVQDVYKEHILPIIQRLTEKFTSFKDSFKTDFGQVTETIGDVTDAIKKVWDEHLKPMVDWIVENLLPIITDIGGFIVENVIDNLKWIWDLVTDVIAIFGDLVSFVVDIATGDWKSAMEDMGKIFDDVFGLFESVIDGIKEKFETLINFLGDNYVVNKIQDLLGLNTEVEVDVNANSPTGTLISTHAGGGFVSAGQLFIAQESGPELVGTIGSQTAVVNNEQIVDAVSVGVANAVASVMSAFGTDKNSGSDVNIFLDGELVGQGIQKALAGMDKRNNLTINYAY